MSTNKRITDLTDYTSVLPYASEIFGVYQPMIGWKSKRITQRLNQGVIDTQNSLLQAYTKNFDGSAQTSFDGCDADITMQVGTLQPIKLLKNSNSVLLQTLARGKFLVGSEFTILPNDKIPVEQEWKEFINKDNLEKILNTKVTDFYRNSYQEQCTSLIAPLTPPAVLAAPFDFPDPTPEQIEKIRIMKRDLENNTVRLLNQESALAGALLAMLDQKLFAQLETLFYEKPTSDLALANQQIAEMLNKDDPFATFDPKREIKNVSLSPLGIVHLFRQYFFELDSFLGTPTGHVWLSPGATVELIEVSTRRVLTEQTIEQSTETTQKIENSATDKDEISEAVKQDNKTDLKLGASLTVNQSWGTGNATATGSLNMENTQSTARETTHKRMREQTSKLSSEIKQNFKSTFKTVTETTDTSSKRYVLTNATPDLINYELRRKMRQVGVQVQDIGTYLCWETFVDEPGKTLGLANLVHIAKPADLVDVPEPTDIPRPSDKSVPFTANVTWNFTDNSRQFNNPALGFLPLTTIDIPPVPEGYDVKFKDGFIDVFQVSATGEKFSGVWAFKGKLIGASKIQIGPFIESGGVAWDNVINFVVGGVVEFKPNDATLKAIADTNNKQKIEGKKATNENNRKTEEVFLNAAKERIELASNINTRKYEDLREEERIIVYRNLIGALMHDRLSNTPDNIDDKTRHTLSELINSIFDIDKMLYFVAPEWWKPKRHHYHQTLGSGNAFDIFTGNLTSWSDLEIRDDNYFITEKSQYAKMGSSLGWLLQLDGDDMRNAFLNAPWVKAVIPIRPGKELAASNWLQKQHVEGTDGLENFYEGQKEELDKIRAALNIKDDRKVTIAEAIKFLCAEVAVKHKASLQVGRYPKEEINDTNRVSATPIDKVYEHGFYPLKGGFRAITSENHEVFDQWIEVLPTDQVVPVEVKYDPKTGRQI
jgi:hypothetical protein